MPATCEYAFVTVRRCSPGSAGVDGKVTAKLVVLSYEILWFWFEPIGAYHVDVPLAHDLGHVLAHLAVTVPISHREHLKRAAEIKQLEIREDDKHDAAGHTPKSRPPEPWPQ